MESLISVDDVWTAADRVIFEHGDVVLGIGTAKPRLSWQVRSNDPDWSQTAYEVELDGTLTVRVESREQVLVPWPFEALESRARASVRVRVASGETWSDWSDPATIEVGLLKTEDWSARFISPIHLGQRGEPAPILFRTLSLSPDVASARLYVTAHGLYSAVLNGEPVGDQVLAPGWTSYPNRLQYQTYDVTSMVRDGKNTLEVLLGDGWFRGGPSQWVKSVHSVTLYGDRLALLAQLEVTYANGSVEVIGTDDQWLARNSGVLENDLFDGQRTDLRPHEPETDAVEILDENLDRLVAPTGPPARITEIVPAVKIFQSASGKTLVDFGQNLVGWVRLHLRGTKAGNEIVIRHAEVLEDGELAVRQLLTAKATDAYILADADKAILEPSLTFHGFRYVEITGVPDLEVDDLQALVVGSDLRRIGWFTCSDPDLVQLHDNIVWSTRGNFLHVPTDCPQRDERQGWTGDIQVFAPTGCFLFDAAGFLASWLADVAAEQRDDGNVPWIVPDVAPGIDRPSAGWGDAATIVPWVLHHRYGDVAILERQFDSMCSWVDKAASLTTNGVWAGGFQFGDWLDPSTPPDSPAAAGADNDVVATAYLARSADLVSEAARILGRQAYAKHYADLAETTRQAFAREYVTSSGRVRSDVQTVYALALTWGLLRSTEQRSGAAARLAELVRVAGFRIGTGFLGTPLITDALTSTGRADLAYRLLLQKECPSWLYPITMGATTIWERWDSMLPDGTVNPAKMVSFNHYAFGAIADWMHRTIAGLAPAAPGYRDIAVRPIPHPSLSFASAHHLTPYGEASAAWRREHGSFTVDITVPVGSTATVELPGIDPQTVRHGHHSWTIPDPCPGTQ